jgi:hypothetical protein
MSERERLPNRRAAELVEFQHGERRWTATVGRFPDGALEASGAHVNPYPAAWK